MKQDGPSLGLDLNIPKPSSTETTSRRGNLVLPVLLLIMLLLLIYTYTYVNQAPVEKPLPPTKGMTHLFSIYGYGTSPFERLSEPNDVAFDAGGNIYVADSGNRRIVVFNGSGRFIRQFPFAESKKGKAEFDDKPIGITVDNKGRIYATSMDSNKMMIFDNNGLFLANIHVPLPIKPRALGEKLYLTATGKLFVFDIKKGDLDKAWSSYGKEEGQIVNPNGLDMALNGDIWVSDSMNSRLQVFDKNGEVKKVIGKPPKDMDDDERLFGTGAGLAIDDQGFVYVVDTLRHSVRVFSPAGKHLLETGEAGSSDGYFQYPAGIAYGEGRRFAIADKQNSRVQVVEIVPPGYKMSVAETVNRAVPIWLAPLLILLALITIYVLRRRSRAGRAQAA